MKTLISQKEIAEVGERLITEYARSAGQVRFVDIEGFITNRLNHEIKYLDMLTEDDSRIRNRNADIDVFCTDDASSRRRYRPIRTEDRAKLGFLSDGKTEIDIWEDGKKKTVCLPKGCVVIDSSLLDAELCGRKRFTLAHEAAHIIIEQLCPLCTGSPSDTHKAEMQNATQLFERRRIIESQADNLASVLLMPKWMVIQALTVYGGDEPIIQYGGCCFSCHDKLVLQALADELGVSFTAILIRLKNLGYIEYPQQPARSGVLHHHLWIARAERIGKYKRECQMGKAAERQSGQRTVPVQALPRIPQR